jgi:hypothetical protein
VSELCFELRRRDLAGRRSPPRTICANEVSVRTDTANAFLPDAVRPNCDLVDGLLALDTDSSSEMPPDAMEDVDTHAMSDGGAQAAAQPPNGDVGSCSIRASSQAASCWYVGTGTLALWLFYRRRKLARRAVSRCMEVRRRRVAQSSDHVR